MFHNQKSDDAFRVVETSVHTITGTDIKQVAKTNEVVAEKENAMQAIKANEKELEIDEKKEL